MVDLETKRWFYVRIVKRCNVNVTTQRMRNCFIFQRYACHLLIRHLHDKPKIAYIHATKHL